MSLLRQWRVKLQQRHCKLIYFFFHADGSERENFDFREMLARQTFSSIMAYFCANKFRKIIFN
jgi:hypothetical protein